VLKKRFPIIASGTVPHYALDTMTDIILTCRILHNFLRDLNTDDSLTDKIDRDVIDKIDGTSR